MGIISPEEKIYIVHGAEHNLRSDGRVRFQYRPIELETDVIPTSMGSARVRIGGTDVVACVKANPFTPSPERGDEGIMDILVFFSGVADPQNEGRLSEDLRDQYTNLFNKLYSTVRLKEWCIVENFKCWKFSVNVCVNSFKGNLFDAVGLAIKAALATTDIPSVKVTKKDKGEFELAVSDDPNDTWTPKVHNIPVIVTTSKLGDNIVVDCTLEEEQCCSCSNIAACTEKGENVFSMKSGAGSLHFTTLNTMIKHSTDIGIFLNQHLSKVISKTKKNRNMEIVGYL